MSSEEQVEKIIGSERHWRPSIQKIGHEIRRFAADTGSRPIRQHQFTATAESPVLRAIEWVRAHENPRGGIYVSSGHNVSYPEVTGYLIPTLLDYNQVDLAVRLTRWLIRIQRRDGSFPSSDGVPHVFDTGQVLRGLLAASGVVPQAVTSGRRAAEYLCGRTIDGGKNGFDVDPIWIQRYSKAIPMSAHLYVLPPLLQAAEVFQKPEYSSAVDNCMEFYLNAKDGLQVETLTHFLAYELEGLIDLGHSEVAIPILNALREQQTENGSVRATSEASWVCTPGLAQLGICWYKIGQRGPADKALNWLETHQMPSGGFRGSYGENSSYFSDVEIPWAAKFYLDAALLRDSQGRKP